MKNSYKKYLFIFVLFLFISFEDVAAYNDKTSVVSNNYTATSDCILYGNLGSGYISVNHRVGMSSGNYLVNPGAPINFYYNPDNPYFVQGNGTWDTPYGEWADSVDSRYYAKFGSFDITTRGSIIRRRSDPPTPYMEYIKNHGQFFCGANCAAQYGYFYWTAVKPAVSIVSSNPSVINCSGMNCTAVRPGVATLTSIIDQTKSRAWAHVDYIHDEYVREEQGLGRGSSTFLTRRVTVVEGVYCADVITNGVPAGSFYLPSTAMSWTVTVNDPTPINGSCGTRNTTYPSATATWIGGSTLCSTGTAVPASVAFPAPGASASWQCQGINGGVPANCSASRAVATINGTCGTKNRNYLFSETVATWNSNSYCSSGTASFPSGAINFPNPGQTTSTWSCIGSGPSHTDINTCRASRDLAVPQVTLTASPSSINNINNNTLTPGTANITLHWNISNVAQACGTGCQCSFVDGGSIVGYNPYPATNSSTKTIGPGTHSYQITCKNPQNISGNASTNITAKCTLQTGAITCSELCGPGNQLVPTLDTNCSFSNVNNGIACNNGNCPISTDFQEVKP